jgi:hypothetical protein
MQVPRQAKNSMHMQLKVRHRVAKFQLQVQGKQSCTGCNMTVLVVV